MSLRDKLMETRADSNSDYLRILAIGLLDSMSGGGGALATEATLISVLNAIVAADQDIEILLVRDTGDSDKVLQQITNYETGTPVVTYKDVNGTTVTPVGPLEYLDPSAVLNLVLAELITLNAGGQLLTEATFVAEDFATETTLAAVNAKLNSLGQKTSAGSVPVVLSSEQEAFIDGLEGLLTTIDAVLDTIKTDTGSIAAEDFATQTTLLATNSLLTTIDTVLDNILLDTASIDTATTGLNTPATGLAVGGPTRASGVGSVTAGKRRISIFNAGNASANVNGGTNNLERGESITWSADGLRDTLGAVAYDGTGTTLVITTVG